MVRTTLYMLIVALLEFSGIFGRGGGGGRGWEVLRGIGLCISDAVFELRGAVLDCESVRWGYSNH